MRGRRGKGRECFSPPPPPPHLFFLFKGPTDDVKRRKPLDAGIRLRLQGVRLGRLRTLQNTKKNSQIEPGNLINSAPYKAVSVLFPKQISNTKLVGRPVSQLLA